MNYSNYEVPFTRIHEFKNFHPEKKQALNKTIIFKESTKFANQDKDPYYPIKTKSDLEILNKYKFLAKNEKNLILGGRMGTYSYLDMDKVISSALNTFNKIVSYQNR